MTSLRKASPACTLGGTQPAGRTPGAVTPPLCVRRPRTRPAPDTDGKQHPAVSVTRLSRARNRRRKLAGGGRRCLPCRRPRHRWGGVRQPAGVQAGGVQPGRQVQQLVRAVWRLRHGGRGRLGMGRSASVKPCVEPTGKPLESIGDGSTALRVRLLFKLSSSQPRMVARNVQILDIECLRSSSLKRRGPDLLRQGPGRSPGPLRVPLSLAQEDSCSS